VNRFSKLIKTLKEAPTNSMGGVYSLNDPGFRVGQKDRPEKIYPDIDGNFTDGIPGNPGDPFYLRPEGYWNGGNNWTETEIPDASQEYLINDPTGKSTSDLIAEDGTVKTAMPPDSRSFILGPLVDGYVYNHGYDNYSNIGYIQKDTRQFVLLARIQGQFIEGLHPQGGRVWDGTTEQLTIYNSNFTLAMAEWFRDQLTANTFTENVPYFYSGGVPQQPQTPAECPNCPPNMFGGVTPGTNGGFGRGTNPTLGTQQGSSTSGNQVQANIFNLTPDQQRTLMNATMLGLDIVAVLAVLFPEPSSSAAGAVHLATKFRYIAKLRRFRGALNPFGQRAVRSGAAGRVRRQVYSGRPYQGKRGFGKTTYGTTNRATARTYSNPGPLKGTPGTGGRVNPRGTVDSGTLPQRYIDKYGSRSVLGQKQVKLGPKAAKRTFGEDYNTTLLEQIINYSLFETAATGSGLGGGMEVADNYVNSVSETSSPEELEQASNDANDIANESGKGLSDSDLAKIDQDAEAEAKRLTNVNVNNPESMDDDQLLSSLDSIYEMNPDWFNDTMDKLDPLIPQSELDKLREEYEEKETTRETSRQTIQGEIDEINKNYNTWGGGAWTDPDGIRYEGSVNWGYQFTKQSFESSGQSFEEYDALRAQLGFFNSDSGPDEYNRYTPLSIFKLFDARENGEKPEQFSGIAYEIVSRSYEMDEISSNKNFPQPGQNIYYTEADYNEAVFLQDEYGRIFSEYVNLIEGPGGFDEISEKAWAFDKRSREAWKQDARDARGRRDNLQSQLDNLSGSLYDDEYMDRFNKILRPFFVTFINEWNEFNSGMNDFETADAYDNYNWLWDNYGIDAAEWYLNNQGLPMESNPFIPVGMYVPFAKAKEDPYSLAGLTPSETANMSPADKKKLKQLLQKLGITKVDIGSYKDNEKLRPQGPSTPVYYDKHMKQIVPTGNEGQILNDILKKAKNNNNQSLVAHFEPQFLKNRERKSLTETRTPKQKRILREIKQPIKVKEAPTKYKMNFEGKFSAQNTPDKTASAQSDALVASGNAKGQKWKQQDKYWSGYETTERMNIINDRVGHGKQAWDMILDESKKRNGWRDKEMQEELNKIAHERAMLKENPDYTSPFGNVEVSTTEKNLQNFEKVNKIKKVVSDKKIFSNKEIKPEYPEEDKESKQRRLGSGRPPELTPDGEMERPEIDKNINYGTVEYAGSKAQTGENAAARYKRLDPISANSMPDAGYPQIDQLRDQARKKAK